jgi:polyisoprenoid-binding protein YceI
MTSATQLGLTTGTWVIDPTHSEVSFTIRHLMSKVRGSFNEFTGAITVAADAAESTVDAEIAMASVHTRNADRDAHLRSAEVLDAEHFPVMRYASSGVRSDGDSYLVTGQLTIKDVTRPVDLNLEFLGVSTDPWGGTRAGFTATTKINRKDFGIDFNVPLEGDRLLLGDTVTITLDIEAIQQA